MRWRRHHCTLSTGALCTVFLSHPSVSDDTADETTTHGIFDDHWTTGGVKRTTVLGIFPSFTAQWYKYFLGLFWEQSNKFFMRGFLDNHLSCVKFNPLGETRSASESLRSVSSATPSTAKYRFRILRSHCLLTE